MSKMKKLFALLLALAMLLTLAACGGDDNKPADTQPADKQSTEPAQNATEEPTEPSTTVPAGEQVMTSRWNLYYDPEVWVWEDEDALSETDYRSMLTMIIPDPENPDNELVWFRVRAMETDHGSFRSNLLSYDFDQYEYVVNNAYETVNIGGLEFLKGGDEYYTNYFTRVFSAGIDVEIMIDGDATHQAVADVLSTLVFTIDEGDNIDPPWPWEGTPYAVEPGEVVVGTYTLNSVQIPFADNIVTNETFDHNVAVVGNTVYIISSNVVSSYSYDGQTLSFLAEHDLGDDYEFVDPAADGGVWCSYLNSPLVKWDGEKVVASYNGTENVAMHPDGSWGISWFTGSDVLKLTFADGVMTTEEVTLADVKSVVHAVFDNAGNLYVCGSSQADGEHRVFVYNKNLELQATLQDDDGTGLGSVTFATSTDNGYLIVDGNMREIVLYTKDGAYIGATTLNKLCGTDYPWPCDACVTDDGSILLIMVDERPDESADELIAFKLSGF